MFDNRFDEKIERGNILDLNQGFRCIYAPYNHPQLQSGWCHTQVIELCHCARYVASEKVVWKSGAM